MIKKETRSLEELATTPVYTYPPSLNITYQWANKALEELGFLEYQFTMEDSASVGLQLILTLMVERIKNLENELKQFKQEKMNNGS